MGRCKNEDKAKVADFLHWLSQMTWQQVFTHKGLNYEHLTVKQVSQWPAHLKERRPESLRMSGCGRLVGYRENASYHVVMVDPLHESYKG